MAVLLANIALHNCPNQFYWLEVAVIGWDEQDLVPLFFSKLDTFWDFIFCNILPNLKNEASPM